MASSRGLVGFLARSNTADLGDAFKMTFGIVDFEATFGSGFGSLACVAFRACGAAFLAGITYFGVLTLAAYSFLIGLLVIRVLDANFLTSGPANFSIPECWQWPGQKISLLQLILRITPCFCIHGLPRMIEC